MAFVSDGWDEELVCAILRGTSSSWAVSFCPFLSAWRQAHEITEDSFKEAVPPLSSAASRAPGQHAETRHKCDPKEA